MSFQPGKTLEYPAALTAEQLGHLEDLLGPLDPEDIEEALELVLQSIIHVEVTGAADNSDILAGTQLDQPGVPGVYTVWVASTVNDTLVTISLGGEQITTGTPVVLRAGPEIRENEDPFFQMLSRTGGRPVININVQTAASFRVRIKFLPATMAL